MLRKSLLLLLALLLLGCATDSDHMNNVQNNNNGDEETEVRKIPPSFQIIREGDKDMSGNDQVGAIMDKRCTKEEGEETCMEPSNPFELLEEFPSLRVRTGGEIRAVLAYSGDLSGEMMPYPNTVTFVKLKDQEDEGEKYVIEDFGKGDQLTYTMPEEEGNYHFLIHCDWTEEEQAEAYYAFKAIVRDE